MASNNTIHNDLFNNLTSAGMSNSDLNRMFNNNGYVQTITKTPYEDLSECTCDFELHSKVESILNLFDPNKA